MVEQEVRKRHPILTFTVEDMKLAEVIIRVDSIKHAAKELALPLHSIYNRGRAIRNQVRRAYKFTNQVLAQCNRSKKLKSFFWPKSFMPEKRPEEEKQEEDET